MESKPARNRRDLSGETFGRLTVLEVSHRNARELYWKCQCSCGKLVSISRSNLKNKSTRSCGCLRKDVNPTWLVKHGNSSHDLFYVWRTMISRCHSEKNNSYPRYGGRGIKVCPEWHIFENFIADMGNRPDGGTIERVDNSKGYSKDNCRWATVVEQARNKPRVRQVQAYGLTMTLPEWSDLSGVKYSTIYYRLLVSKKTPEEAIPNTKKDGSPWTKQDEIDSRNMAAIFQKK